ncbi:endo-1,4-beta-xylanase [Microbacterium sp. AK031]|uniref:endo-1,4-beta-xylanase n=1 Tax=Microbacterium sp. AK031 TaxID=2723076 RepID=UPI00286DE164|nr:endo-1,4-beta-xylanase [Microbacterium sp. AK031]MCS3843628.1 GH35 family endo-1,4-beta-xylanase [Microbacterium sp. AK031]
MAAEVPPIDRTMKHRIAEAAVTVLGADGRPLADTEVMVQQRRHAFSFGNIGFDFIPLANAESEVHATAAGVETFGGADLGLLEHLEELWLDLYNTATLPFYWGRFEPVRGKPDTGRLRKTAQWFADRGITVKGHPLLWHTVTAPWLLDLPVDEVEQAQRARIRREVGDFAGLIDIWDAINEAVIMPVFRNGDNGITRMAWEKGRIATARLAFEEARETNPNATLLINDFDLSSAYECLIEGLLEAGIQIDAIGLQTHMQKGYRGEDAILDAVDRFSRFGLPLHMTENTIVSGHTVPPEIGDLNDYRIDDWPSTPEGEERQADEMERHYRSLVSHPSVQAINYWGLSDSGAWLGAPAGLVRADGSLKPSYDAVRNLIKGDWWLAPTPLKTDASGIVQVRGFTGEYEVSARGEAATFSLPTTGTVTAEARLP